MLRRVLAPVRVGHINGAWLPLGRCFLDVNEADVLRLRGREGTDPRGKSHLGNHVRLEPEWGGLLDSCHFAHSHTIKVIESRLIKSLLDWGLQIAVVSLTEAL